MDRLYKFLVLLTAVAHISPEPIINDCGSTAVVNSVTVSGCADSMNFCPLVRGTDANVTIAFTSNSEAKILEAIVTSASFGVSLPIPVPEQDVCKSGISCPLHKGQLYTYMSQLEVKKSYPLTRILVVWKLIDGNGNDLVCVEIPCEIKKPLHQ
ncbi:NPC intracellular cholesterol transporter 2-like [Stegodyphus dumicola]|uniref:NPC intracellular cholesterol transporter 2-like n=1 Tax=Stegodyphus dumicola TaxID=202533 RepID=UPI0015B097DA|nr:NPC intracellular cholesterol transporter 2-like [Stegodyphus dumicola]